jgi:hypothetical protein
MDFFSEICPFQGCGDVLSYPSGKLHSVFTMPKAKTPSRPVRVKDKLAPLVARVKRKASQASKSKPPKPKSPTAKSPKAKTTKRKTLKAKAAKTTAVKIKPSADEFDWYLSAKQRLSIADKREAKNPFSTERFKKLSLDLLYGTDIVDYDGEFDEY